MEIKNRAGETVNSIIGSLTECINLAYDYMRITNLIITIQEA